MNGITFAYTCVAAGSGMGDGRAGPVSLGMLDIVKGNKYRLPCWSSFGVLRYGYKIFRRCGAVVTARCLRAQPLVFRRLPVT